MPLDLMLRVRLVRDGRSPFIVASVGLEPHDDDRAAPILSMGETALLLAAAASMAAFTDPEQQTTLGAYITARQMLIAVARLNAALAPTAEVTRVAVDDYINTIGEIEAFT